MEVDYVRYVKIDVLISPFDLLFSNYHSAITKINK